jgi:hypothetical protein
VSGVAEEKTDVSPPAEGMFISAQRRTMPASTMQGRQREQRREENPDQLHAKELSG